MKNDTMTVIHSEESGELLAPLEVRRKAFEMLRSRGHAALNDVEKMLGWKSSIGMPVTRMAQQLGVTKDKLRYMLFRNERQEKAKERRIAAKEARTVECDTYTSSQLKFAISLPKNWQVVANTLEPYNLAQELLESIGHAESAEENYRRLLLSERAKSVAFHVFEEAYNRDKQHAYRLFFGKLLGMPPDEEIAGLAARELSAAEAYSRLMEDPQTFLVEFQDFKNDYNTRSQERKARAKKHARLGRMVIGLFQASPPDNENEDEINIEVTKLQLPGPLTAFDLYELDKQSAEVVPWGNRPSKGMVVDGLRGVLYYYLFDTDDPTPELPVFFNLYLAEEDEGWIVSCSCKYGDFYFKTFTKNKPVFKRIVSSFRRI